MITQRKPSEMESETNKKGKKRTPSKEPYARDILEMSVSKLGQYSCCGSRQALPLRISFLHILDRGFSLNVCTQHVP